MSVYMFTHEDYKKIKQMAAMLLLTVELKKLMHLQDCKTVPSLLVFLLNTKNIPVPH